MEGLWRWQVDGNPVWLMQLLIIEGSGAFGQGAIYLLEGQKKAAGRVTNLSKALEGLWGGQYGSTAQQSRLKPQLFFDRYLVIASVATRNIGVYDIKSGQKLALIPTCRKPTCSTTYSFPTDRRHVVQLNSDGQFFLHELATGHMALSGRSVDDEIILYTPEAYYWSSYEGAHFVQLRFPGLPGLFSFQQFAAVLNRPDLIRARLEGRASVDAAATCASAGRGGRAVAGAGGAATGASRSTPGPTKGLRTCGSPDGLQIGDKSVSRRSSQADRAASRLAMPDGSRPRLRMWPAWSRRRRCSAEAGAGRARAVCTACWSASTPMPSRSLSSVRRDRCPAPRGGLENSVGNYYAAESLQLITDNEATPDAIPAALEHMVATAVPHDTLVFSFAGHG